MYCCAAFLYCSERNDGLYRVITYLVAKMVEELGLALLASIVFGALISSLVVPLGLMIGGAGPGIARLRRLWCACSGC